MPGTDCNYYRSDIDFWLPVVEKGSWKNEKLQKLKKTGNSKVGKISQHLDLRFNYVISNPSTRENVNTVPIVLDGPGRALILPQHTRATFPTIYLSPTS